MYWEHFYPKKSKRKVFDGARFFFRQETALSVSTKKKIDTVVKKGSAGTPKGVEKVGRGGPNGIVCLGGGVIFPEGNKIPRGEKRPVQKKTVKESQKGGGRHPNNKKKTATRKAVNICFLQQTGEWKRHRRNLGGQKGGKKGLTPPNQGLVSQGVGPWKRGEPQ